MTVTVAQLTNLVAQGWSTTSEEREIPDEGRNVEWVYCKELDTFGYIVKG